MDAQAQSSLLKEGGDEDGCGKGPAKLPELRFSAKIAAAMDADGLIGVQKQIIVSAGRPIPSSTTSASSIPKLHSKVPAKTHRRRHGCSRRGWRVSRKLRRTPAVLRRFWRAIRSLLTCSSRRS